LVFNFSEKSSEKNHEALIIFLEGSINEVINAGKTLSQIPR
jgi:hypothetical protein